VFIENLIKINVAAIEVKLSISAKLDTNWVDFG